MELRIDGDLEVAGEAGQGKTSVIEAIKAALLGADKRLIRNGADTSQIFVQLTDDLEVERVLRRTEKDLLLVRRAGEPLSEQQAKALCRSLFHDFTFNVVKWVRLSGGDEKGKTERIREQRDELLRAIPFTLTKDRIGVALRGLGEEIGEIVNLIQLPPDLGTSHGLVACATLCKTAYEVRHDVNAEAKAIEVRIAANPAPEETAPVESSEEIARRLSGSERDYMRALGMKDARRSTVERAKELRERTATQTAAYEEALRNVEDTGPIKFAITDAEEAIAKQQRIIQEAQAILEAARAQRDALLKQEHQAEQRNRAVERMESELAASKRELEGVEESLGSEVPDPGMIEEEVEELKRLLDLRKRQDAHDAAVQAWAEVDAKSKALDKVVHLFRETLPAQILAEMEMPIEGLALDEEQLTVNGVPLHQLGTSEQIKVGVRIAMTLNKYAGWICVDGIESVGKADRADIYQACHEAGMQVFATEVDETAEPGPGRVVMAGGKPRE